MASYPAVLEKPAFVSMSHIGWNQLVPSEQDRPWSGTLLDAYQGHRPALHFVPSFAAVPDDLDGRLADCIYGGHRACAAAQRGNVMATQFHPKRSAEHGLNMLRTFLSL